MDTDVLVDKAVLGKQVEIFFDSRVGKFLLARIESEINRGVELLKKVDPEDVKQVRCLQNLVLRAESIESWFSEAIMDGIKATEILEERDE